MADCSDAKCSKRTAATVNVDVQPADDYVTVGGIGTKADESLEEDHDMLLDNEQLRCAAVPFSGVFGVIKLPCIGRHRALGGAGGLTKVNDGTHKTSTARPPSTRGL
jgi:hypothetical protein